MTDDVLREIEERMKDSPFLPVPFTDVEKLLAEVRFWKEAFGESLSLMEIKAPKYRTVATCAGLKSIHHFPHLATALKAMSPTNGGGE